jgi:ABC-type sugar transport system ATPase subunit
LGHALKNDCTVKIHHLYKSFSGVYVLSDVDFDLRPGEIHALVGENGAGKSTFIKILSGAYTKDRGDVFIEGNKIEHLTPHVAQDLGIITIYQDRNLISGLTVGENVLIANEPRGKTGIIKWKKLYDRADEIFKLLNLDLRARDRIADLGAAKQQMVEIAKALYKKAKVVIMDEPTASLTRFEIDHLFNLIKRLKEQEVSVIYISHRLDEVFSIADRVTVLRDGNKVGNWQIGEITRDDLVKAMVGEEVRFTFVGRAEKQDTVLEVENISKAGAFSNIDMTLHRGEIIGIAGMVGSGRTEVALALSGIERVDEGKIIFKGEEIQDRPFNEYIKRGICLIPEDRDLVGLISLMNVAGNISLASLKKISRGPLLRLLLERQAAEKYVDILNIATQGVTQKVKFLSGGNRQKVMLAKWLSFGMDLFLMDEPTQGVDVGAREEIHRIMKDLVNEGKSIVMITSDFDELMNMSHKIIVMSKRQIVAVLNTSQTTQEEVLSFAIGKSAKTG